MGFLEEVTLQVGLREGGVLGLLPWGHPAVPLPRDPSSLSRAHLADRTIIRDLGLFLASDHV